MAIELVKFKHIRHSIPAETLIMQYHKAGAGQRDEELVLHITGDVVVGNLDLDLPLQSFKNQAGIPPDNDRNPCMIILIEGNCTAENIFNLEDDGSCSLVVKGDLTTNNMVVGGQEIFITGNLLVNECFWGNYNHGELIVQGDTHARVFVATDEYHYDYEKQKTTADFFLCDFDSEADEDLEREIPAAIFVDAMLQKEDEVDPEELFTWAGWLSRSTAISLLENSEPILKTTINLLSDHENEAQFLQSIPKQFGACDFTDANSFLAQVGNYRKLIEIAKTHPEHTQFFEWDGFDIRVHHRMGEEAEADYLKTDYILAMHHESGLEFFIQTPVLSGVKKWLFQKAINDNLVILFRTNTEDDFTELFAAKPTPDIISKAQELWKELLDRAEKGYYVHQQFQQLIKPGALLRYLNLPVVLEKYNDYWDSDKKGFWYGNYYFAFKLHGSEDMVGSVDIGKEIVGETFDLRKYLLRPDKVDNPTFVELFYTSSVEGTINDRYSGEECFKVFLYDWELYREVMQWYLKVERALTYENNNYLAGKSDE